MAETWIGTVSGQSSEDRIFDGIHAIAASSRYEALWQLIEIELPFFTEVVALMDPSGFDGVYKDHDPEWIGELWDVAAEDSTRMCAMLRTLTEDDLFQLLKDAAQVRCNASDGRMCYWTLVKLSDLLKQAGLQ